MRSFLFKAGRNAYDCRKYYAQPLIKKRANHSTHNQGLRLPAKKIEEMPTPKNSASIVLKFFFTSKVSKF